MVGGLLTGGEFLGALTPVGRLIDAEPMAREVITRVRDVPRDSFGVTLDS